MGVWLVSFATHGCTRREGKRGAPYDPTLEPRAQVTKVGGRG